MAVTSLRILVDNRSAAPGLGFEHGWSVWLDLGGDGAWLWDTGQTGLFLDNAAALGLDPLSVRGVAVSHGHHDHAGGLPRLFKAGYAGPLVGHPDIFARRYSRRDRSTYRSIGMGDGRLAEDAPGFVPVTNVLELGPGLTFVTGIARRPGFLTATADLFRDTAGAVPDEVADDACLIVDGADGPLVLLGCCHSGLANTLWHIRRRLGLQSIDTVVGGLHLAGAGEAALAETARALREFGVRRVFAGHCTGETAAAYLRDHAAGETTPTGSGLVIRP